MGQFERVHVEMFRSEGRTREASGPSPQTDGLQVAILSLSAQSQLDDVEGHLDHHLVIIVIIMSVFLERLSM